MNTYWILFIGIAILSYIVQANVQSKFKKYSKIPLSNGMTGKEVAEKMLRDNGIYDVKVTSTPGMLTDHYNPANKTVNLSEGVYGSHSVAAAAVAAHECGHAVQHARAYAPLKMRSALVPIVQFSSSIVSWVLLAGILLVQSFPGLLLAGIVLFATTTLFSIITLPVEIYNYTKKQLQPKIYAMFTMLFLLIFVLMVVMNLLQLRQDKNLQKRKGAGK